MLYGEMITNSCHVQSICFRSYKSLDPRNIDQSAYSCLLFEENRPSGCKGPRKEAQFLVKHSFWRRTMLFTANLCCADFEQALEQEVVASLPSKSCQPTSICDVSFSTANASNALSTMYKHYWTFFHALFKVCFRFLGSRKCSFHKKEFLLEDLC